jgi:hypothetical protein
MGLLISFCGPLQTAQAQAVVPSTVRVGAPATQKATLGEELVFLISFNRAPRGYDGGHVTAVFRWESRASALPPQIARRDDDQIEVSASTPMQDGTSNYALYLKLYDSMALGKWSLAEIRFGDSSSTVLPVKESVSFELIGPDPVQIDLSSPSVVHAGDSFQVSVSLRALPKNQSPNCILFINANLRSVDGKSGSFDLGTFQPKAGELTHTFPPFKFKSDLGSAKFAVQTYVGARIPDSSYQGCKVPPVEGNTSAALEVEPSANLVAPTSVDVTVNPTQVEILKVEAERLGQKASALEQVAKTKQGLDPDQLRESVIVALRDVERTERSFNEARKQPSIPDAVNVFFDDIRHSYGEARKTLSVDERLPVDAGASIELASFSRATRGPGKHGDNVVIASIRRNAAAYSTVAAAGSMTFDIEIRSFPAGATVSYAKYADDEFELMDDKTNTILRNRPYAVWFVKFELAKHKTQTIKCDPYADSRHLVEAQLEPE